MKQMLKDIFAWLAFICMIGGLLVIVHFVHVSEVKECNDTCEKMSMTKIKYHTKIFGADECWCLDIDNKESTRVY